MASRHRVEITGAFGFVGRWLQTTLEGSAGNAEIEIVRIGRGPNCDVRLDIANGDDTIDAIRSVAPTAVVHLAAVASPAEARGNPSIAWMTNFNGTLNLARAILAGAPGCRFIFAGSSESYGSSFTEAGLNGVTENHALKPMTTYAATKAAADIAVGQLTFDGLNAIRFRPFNHTGPGQTQNYVIPAFASQIANIQAGRTRPIIEVGNLEAYRDFLDVRDVARAYAMAALGAEKQPVEGGVFNLASGDAIRIGSILQFLIDRSGMQIEILVSPERFRPNDIAVAKGNSGAALAAFGWRPEITLEQTLADVLDDWSNKARL